MHIAYPGAPLEGHAPNLHDDMAMPRLRSSCMQQAPTPSAPWSAAHGSMLRARANSYTHSIAAKGRQHRCGLDHMNWAQGWAAIGCVPSPPMNGINPRDISQERRA
jgi:hypothetical protein